jgi:hypothetical protein
LLVVVLKAYTERPVEPGSLGGLCEGQHFRESSEIGKGGFHLGCGQWARPVVGTQPGTESVTLSDPAGQLIGEYGEVGAAFYGSNESGYLAIQLGDLPID